MTANLRNIDISTHNYCADCKTHFKVKANNCLSCNKAYKPSKIVKPGSIINTKV